MLSKVHLQYLQSLSTVVHLEDLLTQFCVSAALSFFHVEICDCNIAVSSCPALTLFLGPPYVQALPRRRVSVAVVPKFNLLNIPGQPPATSPVSGPSAGPSPGAALPVVVGLSVRMQNDTARASKKKKNSDTFVAKRGANFQNVLSWCGVHEKDTKR